MAQPEPSHAEAAPAVRTPKRRLWLRMALVLAAPLIAALLALALIEFRIPADFAHQRIEQAAREATGLHVRFEGRSFLLTGPRPAIEISGLVVEAGTQAAKLEILRLGVGRAEFDLRALFAREIRVRRVMATDLWLRLDAPALEALATAGRAAEKPAARQPSESASGSWRFASLGTLQVERARWTFAVATLGQTVDVEVKALTLHSAGGEALAIDASGEFAGEPMKVAFRTAPLDALLAGAKTIPIDLRVALEDASFSAKGTLEPQAPRGDYAVEASARASFFERFLPGFRAALEEMREASAAGRVRIAPGEASFDSVSFAAGRTRAWGEIHRRVAGDRATVRGRIEFEALDLAPWLPVLRGKGAKAPKQSDPLDSLRALQQATDVDLEAKAATVMWPEPAASDVRLALRVDKGAAALDANARLRAGTLRAKARLETAQREARLSLDAQAGPVALEGLHPAIGRAGVSGVVRSARLSANGRGSKLAALLLSLEGELDISRVEAAWRPAKDREPLRVAMDSARLSATRDALRGSLAATIADARIALNLSGKRAEILEEQREVRGAFDFSVRRARVPGTQLAARGALALDGKSWSAELMDARLGASRGTVALKGAWRGAAPLQLRAALERLDLKALEFFDFGDRVRSAITVPAGRWQDIHLLPAETPLPDADFDLRAKRLDAAPLRFDDTRITGRSREGRLTEARVETRTKGGTLAGELNADLRGKVPQLQASVTARNFDAASLLALADVKASRAIAGTLDAKLDLRGASLGQAVPLSTLQATAQDLDVALPGLMDARRTLRLSGRAELGSAQGRLSASGSGTLDGHSFTAGTSGGDVAALLAGQGSLPVEVAFKSAGNQIDLRGTLAKGPRADLQLRVEAKRADELLALAGVRTDARGALVAQAQLKLAPLARYEFDKLELRLGESVLAGRILADWSGKRPKIEATLAGPRLRLHDLGIGGREAKPTGAPAKPAAQKDSGADWIEALRGYDATLALKVEQLYAEGELIGGLQASAQLTGGRLRVAPFEIRQAASVLRGAGEIDATPAAPEFSARAELQRYNLTPLLHAFRPHAPGTATLDARASLRGRGLGGEAIASLQGAFDVAGYGHDVGSGGVGHLGINLFRLALSSLDRDASSRINCAVGVFDIDKGVMKSRALFLDTTRLRIMGNLDVELASGALSGALRPHPKNPSLFSVNTPLTVGGTVDAPQVALATGALPGLLIRYSNPYTIFLGSLMDVRSSKPDGSDDCRAAYAKADAARPELGEQGRSLFRLLP